MHGESGDGKRKEEEELEELMMRTTE